MRRIAVATIAILCSAPTLGCAMSSTSIPTPYGRATSRTFSIGNAEVHQNRKIFQGEMTGTDFHLRLDASGELSGLASNEEVTTALGVVSKALGGL